MRFFIFIFLLIFAKTSANDFGCSINPDFVEPKQEVFIQKKLQRYTATLEDLRKVIATDNKCTTNEVVFLRFSESLGSGYYYACVNGKKVKYLRNSRIFRQNFGNDFYDAVLPIKKENNSVKKNQIIFFFITIIFLVIFLIYFIKSNKKKAEKL